MDTFTPAWVSHHARIRLTTCRALDVVDLTDRLDRLVADTRLDTGLVNIQTTHTTTAIVVNEDEPLLHDDFRELLDRLAPHDRTWRHDDLTRRANVPADEPRNGHAHGKALLLPTAATLNVIDGRLVLGRWQRVFLLDLDGPRDREISMVATGTAR